VESKGTLEFGWDVVLDKKIQNQQGKKGQVQGQRANMRKVGGGEGLENVEFPLRKVRLKVEPQDINDQKKKGTKGVMMTLLKGEEERKSNPGNLHKSHSSVIERNDRR